MAANMAPTEYLERAFGIHMPLPIAPVDISRRKVRQGFNDHHRLFDSEDERIKTPDLVNGELDERRIARWAGLQYGSKWLHGRYHDAYDEVWLPEDEHHNFALGILFSARMLPTHAVDVQHHKPRIVPIDEAMRLRFQQEGVLHQQEGRRWAIGYFFGRYILRHGLDEVIETDTVAQFIDEKTEPKLKLRLGFRIISAAAEVVLDPIEGLYQQARQEGQISLETPETARRFLMKHFDNRQPDYFATIEERARAA